jgi:transposase
MYKYETYEDQSLIGFDAHKKSVSYCVKIADGNIVEEGQLPATHRALREWAGKRSEAWHGAMEATLFSGWMYDTQKPFAAKLQMGNPSRMKAIAASWSAESARDPEGPAVCGDADGGATGGGSEDIAGGE